MGAGCARVDNPHKKVIPGYAIIRAHLQRGINNPRNIYVRMTDDGRQDGRVKTRHCQKGAFISRDIFIL